MSTAVITAGNHSRQAREIALFAIARAPASDLTPSESILIFGLLVVVGMTDACDECGHSLEEVAVDDLF